MWCKLNSWCVKFEGELITVRNMRIQKRKYTMHITFNVSRITRILIHTNLYIRRYLVNSWLKYIVNAKKGAVHGKDRDNPLKSFDRHQEFGNPNKVASMSYF